MQECVTVRTLFLKRSMSKVGTPRNIVWECVAQQQNRFSLPQAYLWHDQKFETLFQWAEINTLFKNCFIISFPVQTNVRLSLNNTIREGLLLMVLAIMMKSVAFLRNVPNSRQDCKNHTLFMTEKEDNNSQWGTLRYTIIFLLCWKSKYSEKTSINMWNNGNPCFQCRPIIPAILGW